jgi:hypothetical protein
MIAAAEAGDAKGASLLPIKCGENKGEYRPLIRGGEWIGAYLSCPRCGYVAGLGEHEISDDGVVSPSVICGGQGCDFHENIRLKGWMGRKDH